MNERINLRFHDFSPEVAAFMLACARSFAVSKMDGRPGPGHGTGFRSPGGRVCHAYWTKARAIVVVEQAPVEAE